MSVTLLVGGLTFGYMIGNVSAVIAAMGKQEELLRERMDTVKDYVAWRNMPTSLAARIKSYYAYYYTIRPVFDEREIIGNLNPSLKQEAMMTVLSETVGRLPMLQAVLDGNFQIEVFPLLKPIAYMPGEVVHRRGDLSDDLLFLLEGQVATLGTMDTEVLSEINPTNEHLITRTEDNQAVRFRTLATNGCFGESIFTHSRRPLTTVATRASKALYISRDDIVRLYRRNPKSMRRLRIMVVRPAIPRHRMIRLSRALRANSLKMQYERYGEVRKQWEWAALIMQRAWDRREQSISMARIWALEFKDVTNDTEIAAAKEAEEMLLGTAMPYDRPKSTSVEGLTRDLSKLAPPCVPEPLRTVHRSWCIPCTVRH